MTPVILTTMDEQSDLLEVLGAARNGLCDTTSLLEKDVQALCDYMTLCSENNFNYLTRVGPISNARALKAQLALERYVSRRKVIFEQLDTNIRLLEKMHRLLNECHEEKERLFFTETTWKNS